MRRLNVGGTYTMIRAAVGAGFGDDGGTVVNVTVSPHHGMPAMAPPEPPARRSKARARARRRVGAAPIAVVAAAIGASTPSRFQYPEVVWKGAARSVPLQRLGTMQEFGWLVALLAGPLGRALSGSVVTLDGAADNWFGPWPPPTLTDDAGAVPTEERRG